MQTKISVFVLLESRHIIFEKEKERKSHGYF